MVSAKKQVRVLLSPYLYLLFPCSLCTLLLLFRKSPKRASTLVLLLWWRVANTHWATNPLSNLFDLAKLNSSSSQTTALLSGSPKLSITPCWQRLVFITTKEVCVFPSFSMIQFSLVVTETNLYASLGNIDLGTACGKYFRVSTLSITDAGMCLRISINSGYLPFIFRWFRHYPPVASRTVSAIEYQ